MLRRTPLKAKREKTRRNEGRVTHERMARKPSAKPNAQERKHFERVAALGCVVDGCSNPANIHHVTSDGMKRIARSHTRVVNLCKNHHQDGPCAVHRVGHARFTETFGIDLLETAERLWEESNA